MPIVTRFEVSDVRFPTSRFLDGSDAMNPDPDYSAAYLVLGTDDPDGREGHGFCFTIGRGNEIMVAAIESLADSVLGRDFAELSANLGDFGRELSGDSQMRWLGPEKGVIHMANSAVLNAVWDLHAKGLGKPLWEVLSSMTPSELVDLVDFRYIADAVTPREAHELLQRQVDGREERRQHLLSSGYPAYTTSPGWLGYTDEKMVALCRAAAAAGFKGVKLKVGVNKADDLRRLRLAREALGDNTALMIDANQAWDVEEAADWMLTLKEHPLGWVEEPTSPDDILGHASIRKAIAPTPVATGEHVHNRVMFKQLFQSGSIDVAQPDVCRLAGINEMIAVLVMAAKFGIRVCPHTGGVGLCELAQHVSMFDYVAVSGRYSDRCLEYVDHLHEHFVDPVRIANGNYLAPSTPGSSAEIHAVSRAKHSYPDGEVWAPVKKPPSPRTQQGGAIQGLMPAERRETTG